ncbi:hypothetical protein TNCV_3086941 [Trichonephila clavipes]|nr:hypothetical protein TNCV_3086941 [Trichonephila clavipes]
MYFPGNRFSSRFCLTKNYGREGGINLKKGLKVKTYFVLNLASIDFILLQLKTISQKRKSPEEPSKTLVPERLPAMATPSAECQVIYSQFGLAIHQTIIKQGVDSSNGPKTRWPLFPIFISEFCLAMKRTSGGMATSTNKTAAFEVKLIHKYKPQTLDHLEDNIHRVIADIRPQMLEKVIENWTSILDCIRASRGSPMPEIIFKM